MLKKQFAGVGVGVTLFMAAVACTNTPQSATSPTAARASDSALGADGSTLKVGPPALINPIDGVRAEDRRPTLIWANAVAKYGSVGMAYDLELSTPNGTVVYARTVGESPDFGTHRVDLELDYDATYSWRMRGRVGNEMGPWSTWASFVAPARPTVTVVAPTTPTSGGCAAPISALGPGETRKPRPNESGIVAGVAAQFPAALRNSCQNEGGSWEFMDRAVDALRAKDGRWGYNAKRGNTNDPSLDVVSYYYAGGNDIQGRPEVYLFDLIGGHCGPAPSTIWVDQTDITASSGTIGRTIFPRPGRVVAACAAK